MNGDVSIATMLIAEFHADKGLNDSGDTPLHLAVFRGHIESRRRSTRDASTAGREKNEKTEVVEWLIADFGADLNTKDKLNQTPLHKAATIGSWKTVELLGNRLHLTAENAIASTVTLLVTRFHARINITDNLGQTPLHLAVKCPSWKMTAYIRVVRFLVHVDTDINATDSNNMTPLDIATNNGFIQAVEMFKSATAN
ncbi:ankyrin repeat-containing domain protein [Endogone sp. FLAS-F59071]|nr:ankyrin repeat-containing domain protein [Endogone sp. FLAS-F59071]|eukprot:RUS13044.1 ankyrin repeat-containing domain protein [Endogone sp. FLAS-F59071]